MDRVAANSPAAIGLRRQTPAECQSLARAKTKMLPSMCQKTKDRRKFEKTGVGDRAVLANPDRAMGAG